MNIFYIKKRRWNSQSGTKYGGIPSCRYRRQDGTFSTKYFIIATIFDEASCLLVVKPIKYFVEKVPSFPLYLHKKNKQLKLKIKYHHWIICEGWKCMYIMMKFWSYGKWLCFFEIGQHSQDKHIVVMRILVNYVVSMRVLLNHINVMQNLSQL